jgi:uncharacterized protein HemX
MSESDLQVVCARLDDLRNEVKELRAELRELRERPSCPAPGTCLQLRTEMEDMRRSSLDRENRIRELEKDRDKAVGAGIAMKIVWAVMGAGVLAMAYQVFRHIAEAKP